ncbi:MAG: hypothetical protein VX501_07510 [Pseudomonadota bacterium]|nr:hypothetical protein [Pseudomonadota bacterium]
MASNAGNGAVFGEGVLAPDALRAANINPVTGLATDYLNHFNEVVMLMEMLPDMRDCAEDVLEWKPASYTEHFEMSAFKDRDLAVLAYEAAPRSVRVHLETLILQIDEEVLRAQDFLRASQSPEICNEVARMATEDIKPLIAAASGAINGQEEAEADYEDESVQADIDALFG